MSLLREFKESTTLTEREMGIRDYLLNHPEDVLCTSSRQLAELTLTSAATVTRFCKKFGCDGWPEFKLQFVSDLKSGVTIEPEEFTRISERENMATLLQKISDVHEQSLDTTKKELSLSQLLRIQKLLLERQYTDFYTYDTNVHLARYAASQFYHAGKIAMVYSETNVQLVSAMLGMSGHLAIVISHTGENTRLIELVRLLKQNGTKVIVLAIRKDTTLAEMADEFLLAAAPWGMDRLNSPAFFTSAKYLLDLMFAIIFSAQYETHMARNKRFDAIGDNFFWALTDRYQHEDM